MAKASGCNTEWRFTPKGCPWWARQVERVVGMAKRTLHNLLARHTCLCASCLPAASCLCARIAFLLNSRPVATLLQRAPRPGDLLRPQGQESRRSRQLQDLPPKGTCKGSGFLW